MKRFSSWSTIFFIAPLILAFYFKAGLTVGILVAVIVASTLYHLSEEKKYGWLDSLLAWSLILSNFYIAYLGDFTFPYFVLAIFIAIPAIYIYFEQGKNYDLRHGLWHVLSSLITIFSILALVL